MKRLHKKIGVGVLVAGLLIGGGLSKGSVSHADSNQQSILKKISDLGDERGFYLDDSYSVISPKQLKNFRFKFFDYDSFEKSIESLRGIEREKPIIKGNVDGVDVVLLFYRR